MSRFNEVFGGEPSDQPDWMKEFARGGDPGVHKEGVSQPLKDLAEYNPASAKAGQAVGKTPLHNPGVGHTNKLLSPGADTSKRGPAGSQNRKKEGGCGCGGEGKCKSAFSPSSINQLPSPDEVVPYLKAFLAETGGPSVADEMLRHMIQVAMESDRRKGR